MKRMLPICIFTLAALNAYADENVTKLDSVVVSTSGVSPQTASVYSDDISVRQPQSMADVLRNVPGVQAGHPASIGQRYKIRGLDDQFVNVTVDGARQEGYHFHHSGNFAIDPELMKRVDVNVGVNSITYDAGTLGGAIKFQTADADDLLAPGQLFGGKVKLAYGSNGNEFQQALSLYGKAGIVDLLGYFSHRGTNDYKVGKPVVSANGRKTVNSDGDAYNYLVKAKVNFTDEQYAKFSAEYLDNDAVVNQRLNFPDMGGEAIYEQERQTYTLGYGFNPIENDFINLTADAYWTEQDSTHMKSVDKVNPGFDSYTTTKGIKLKNRAEFNTAALNHGLIAGYEYFDYKAQYNTYQGAGKQNIESVKSHSVYIEDAIRIGQFTVTPGIRFDHFKYDTLRYLEKGGRGKPVVVVHSEPFNKSYSRFSKALGLQYDITSGIVVFADYTELFRGPYGKEISMGYTDNAANLKATKGYNLETGISTFHENLFTSDDSLRFSAKIFQTKYKDFATTLIGRALHNLPKSKIEGGEVSAEFNIANFGTRLSYAKANNKITQNHPDHIITGLEFVPSIGDTYTLGFTYELPAQDLELGWNSRFVQAKTTNGLGGRGSGDVNVHKKGYGVSDVYIAWAPKSGVVKGMDVIVGIDNIFNKYYNDHSYYLNTSKGSAEKGRNIKATVSYKF